MRILLLIITLILVSSYSYADNHGSQSLREYFGIKKEPFNFRKTRWGMSIEQVKQSEDFGKSGWKLTEQKDDRIMYAGKLFGESCELLFGFSDDGKLDGASYSFAFYLGNSSRVGLLLNEQLIKKYGNPQKLPNSDGSKRDDSMLLQFYSKDKKTRIQALYTSYLIIVTYEDKSEAVLDRGVNPDVF